MVAPKTTEIRGTRTSLLLGYLAGGVMKLWSLTLRYDVNDESGVVQPDIHPDPVIFALWHNRIFTMPPIWQRTGGKSRTTVVLTSASKDGTTLATAMKMFGLGAIRGSSSRRAVSALIGMKKSLREGHDVCVTPDGLAAPLRSPARRHQNRPGHRHRYHPHPHPLLLRVATENLG